MNLKPFVSATCFRSSQNFPKGQSEKNVNLTVTPYFRIFLSKWIFTPFFTRLAIKVPMTSQDALHGSFTVQFLQGQYGTTVKPVFIFGCLSILDSKWIPGRYFVFSVISRPNYNSGHPCYDSVTSVFLRQLSKKLCPKIIGRQFV